MMKKIFRPFWSFDVKKTEEWLSSMALQGLHFVTVRPFISLFVFEAGAHLSMGLYHTDPGNSDLCIF